MSRMEEKEIRKSLAGEKQQAFKEKQIQTKMNLMLKNGDDKVKEEWSKYLKYDEQEREMRMDMAEAKENLWKWRTGKKNKNGGEKVRKKFSIDKGEVLDRRISKLDEIMVKCEEERAGEMRKRELFMNSKDDIKKKRMEIKRQQEE